MAETVGEDEAATLAAGAEAVPTPAKPSRMILARDEGAAARAEAGSEPIARGRISLFPEIRPPCMLPLWSRLVRPPS